MGTSRTDGRDRFKPAGIAVTVGMLLAVAVAALGASGEAATAATDGRRVGVWRFGETEEGKPAVAAGRTHGRGAVRLTDEPDGEYDGQILVVGGFVPDSVSDAADMYDPQSGSWESLESMNYGRSRPDVVALPDGRALVTGGADSAEMAIPQELYDPDRAGGQAWMETPPAPMDVVHTATRVELRDGTVQVLATGTTVAGQPAAAVFDPSTATGTWTRVEAPARIYETTTRLARAGDGSTSVLAVIGDAASGGDTKAEIYDPDAQAWADATANLAIEPKRPVLAGLEDGGALLISNDDAFRYRGDEWVSAPNPGVDRHGEEVGLGDAVRLPSGNVLITGRREAELFLPDQGDLGQFVLAGYAVSRFGHTTTVLPDGAVLVAGGIAQTDGDPAPTELYFPPSRDAQPPPPEISDRIQPGSALLAGGVEVTVVGSGFSDAEQVMFGSQPATEFRIVDHGRVVATAPPVEAPGKVTVQVDTPQGTAGPPGLAAFEYVRPAGAWAPAGADGAALELKSATDDPDFYDSVEVDAMVRDTGEVVIFSKGPPVDDPAARLYVYDPAKGTLETLTDVEVSLPKKFVPLSDDRVMVLKDSFPSGNNTGVVYDLTDGSSKRTRHGAPSVDSNDPAVLLDDGRVLVLADSEASLYDPAALSNPEVDAWRTQTVPDPDPDRGTTDWAAVTKLEDGRVLVSGGGGEGTGDPPAHKNARLFDPEDEEWSAAPKMAVRRGLSPRGSARLSGGEVLIAGGVNPIGGNKPVALRDGELFDPEADGGSGVGAWNGIHRMRAQRSQHTVTTLTDGSVLAAGGLRFQRSETEESRTSRLRSAEVYRPQLDRWQPTGKLRHLRADHAAVALSEGSVTEGCGPRCGSVLVVGGGQDPPSDEEPTRSLEVYTPRPRVDSVQPAGGPLAGGDEVTITGQFFAGVDSVSFGGVQSDDVTVVSQTEIKATVPPRGSNGPVPVTVTNDVAMGDGQTKALGSLADEAPRFTYIGRAGLVDDLQAQAESDSEIALSWSAVDAGDASAAQGYVVAQSSQGPIDSAGDFADAFTLCGGVCDQFDPPPQAVGDEVTLTVSQLQPGTAYHYAVAPVNVDGNRGPISDSASATTAGTPPDDGTSNGDGGDGTNGGGTGGGGTGGGGAGGGGTGGGGAGGGGTGGGGTSDQGGSSTDDGGTSTDGQGQGGSSDDGGQGIGERGVEVARLAGPDRIATSVQASREAFGAGQAGAVVLARADEFADGLAGVPFARAVDGPLLLTHSDALEAGVADELQRVLGDSGAVWLLGGEAALSGQVEQRIAELGYEPKRLAGRNRFETAAVIAEFGLSSPDRVLLSTGGEFADAVTAGAAAAHTGGAVLLTAGDQLPPSTAGYLDEFPPAQQHAVGGPAAAAVPEATPLVGATRYETAARVAGELFDAPDTVGLATGTAFPDPLSGGAHVARYGGPMLLSGPDRLHPAAADYLAGHSSVTTTVLYGGTAALTQAVADGAQAAVAGSSQSP